MRDWFEENGWYLSPELTDAQLNTLFEFVNPLTANANVTIAMKLDSMEIYTLFEAGRFLASGGTCPTEE